MPKHPGKKKQKLLRPLLIVLFLCLLSLLLALFFIGKSQEIRKKAAEITPRITPPTPPLPAYAKGEVLVKFKTSALGVDRQNAKIQINPEKAGQGVDSDKQAVDFNDLDENSLPLILKNLNQKYKFSKIEKVFKGAQDPKTELAKFKQKFGKEITEGKRSINEEGVLKIDLSRTYKISFDKSISVEQMIQDLSPENNPEIEYAEPNYIFKTQLIPNDPYYLDHYPDNVNNRDPIWNPSYDYQWNLKKINIEDAWNITTGNNNVKVAVIDTGVDCAHQELAGICLPGYDFVNSDSDPTDDNGHGTHVAGIISSLSNNDGGIASISWQSKIVPVKGLGSNGDGDNAVLANSIVYASNQGVQIINMSWGNVSPIYNIPQVLKDALDYAYSHSVVLVAAAGNSNDKVENGYWPANYEHVISVSATDENNQKAGYSNFGNIDVAAPGGSETRNLLSLNAHNPYNPSAYLNLDGFPVGDGFLRLAGTSMSAPHVSALAALLLSKTPSLSNEEVSSIIGYTAQDLGDPGKDDKYGYGLIDALQAVNLDQPPPIAKIIEPGLNYSVFGKIEIKGKAYGRDFNSYQIQLSQENSSIWSNNGVTLINNGNSEINNGILGYFDPSGYPESKWKIKLTAFGKIGTKVEDITSINIIKTVQNNNLAGYCNNSSIYSIQNPDFLTIKDDEDFTIEAWIKPDLLSTSQQILFARSSNSGVLQLRLSLLAKNQDYNSLADIRFSTGPTSYISVNNAIPFKQWTHIGALKQGNGIKLFINGELKGEANYISVNPNEEGKLYLCSWFANDMLFYPYTGAIDELRISKTARDIQGNWSNGIYQRSLDIDENTTVFFKFDQNTMDSSGNQHHINPEIKYVDSIIRDETDFGNALYLDPVSANHQPAYIAIPDNNNLALIWPIFTIEGWIEPHDEVINGVNRNNPSYILAKEALPDTGNGTSFPYSIAITNGYLEFKVKLQDGQGNILKKYLKSKTALIPNQWYFFKTVINNLSYGSNYISLYLNNSLEAHEEFVDGYINDDPGLLTIGCAKISNFPLCLSNYFGAIDDLRISFLDRSYFPQINKPFPVDSYTIGLWKFNGNPLDSGIHKLDGVINGNVEFSNIRYITSGISPILSPSSTPTPTPSPTIKSAPSKIPIPSTTVLPNSASGKSCNDICSFKSGNCISVGLNSTATDGGMYSFFADPSHPDQNHCALRSSNVAKCNTVMIDRKQTLPSTCGGNRADWTNCRCSKFPV